MSKENVEIVRRAWDHLSTTMSQLEAVMSPDYVWDMSCFSGWPEQLFYEGVEGGNALMRDWGAHFDDWRVEAISHHDAGDDVVTILRQYARARVSGVPVEMDFAVVSTVRDGLITRAKAYSEAREALESAGLEA